MKAKLIDGKSIAKKVKLQVKERAELFLSQHKIKPCLATILVGQDPASEVYVRNKIKATEDSGLISLHHSLPETTSEAELLQLINELNQDDSVHGILVQLPLPKHISAKHILAAISPKKDVDGFHALNMGELLLDGIPMLAACTPAGILTLLKESNVEIKGKHAVVVGRSTTVGKPMALLLINQDATVTLCHRHTQNLAHFTRQADILVVAVGKRNLITEDMVKAGAVVIDVGINKTETGQLCGDVDFENVSEVTSLITPVPGGVGPMTIAQLLANTLSAAEHSKDTK